MQCKSFILNEAGNKAEVADKVNCFKPLFFHLYFKRVQDGKDEEAQAVHLVRQADENAANTVID